MKLKLIVRYTSGSTQEKFIDPDYIEDVVEAMNSTDFASLTLVRIHHPGDYVTARQIEQNHIKLMEEVSLVHGSGSCNRPRSGRILYPSNPVLVMC